MTSAAHLTLADSEQFKHTPEPWTFMTVDTWAKCKGPRKLSPIAHVGGYVVTTLEKLHKVHATDEDDANFICHAVNCHADMLAALKHAEEAIAWYDAARFEMDGKKVGEVVNAAIDLAEGRTP